MESRTLRYRTNVPFCNACSEERDSHREVILILKLAYRINLSSWKLFFSWNILARSSENSEYSKRVMRNVMTDTLPANQIFCQEKWNDKFQSMCSRPLCFTTARSSEKCRNYSNLSNRGTPYNESHRTSLYSYTRFFPCRNKRTGGSFITKRYIDWFY